MSFSVPGTLIGLILLIPPLCILPFFPPLRLPQKIKREAVSSFAAMQIIGRMGALIILMFSESSFQNIHITFFTDAMIFCIFFEYYLWIRYLAKGRYYGLLLEPFHFLPFPLLSLPLLAYLSACIWTKNIVLGFDVLAMLAGDIFLCVKYETYRSVIVYREEEDNDQE